LQLQTKTETKTQTKIKTDLPIYLLGAFLGICAGTLDVKARDLLLTALFVLASTMLLGILRPEKPWRWILLVGACVPLTVLLAYLVLTEKPYPAQIYESFLGFLTATAGAYGGSACRRAFMEIFSPE
jgi:ABC-type multidrug transport system permease subunit